MAQGIEVVQATLAGKRVRLAAWGPWYVWDADVGKFRDEAGGYWGPSSRQLLTDTWEIEEPSMTFTEADAAMVKGHIVERPARTDTVQYKWDRGTYWMRYRSDDLSEGWSSWQESGFYADDIHATDWRIVAAHPRPSARAQDVEDLICAELQQSLALTQNPRQLAAWLTHELQAKHRGLFPKGDA